MQGDGSCASHRALAVSADKNVGKGPFCRILNAAIIFTISVIYMALPHSLTIFF